MGWLTIYLGNAQIIYKVMTWCLIRMYSQVVLPNLYGSVFDNQV